MAKKITSSGLKPAVNSEDKEFVSKLATIEALSQKLSNADAAEKNVPSLIIVRLSLASLREAHQETPIANAEASDLLAQQLGQFVDAAHKYFGDNVLIATVANSEQSVIRQRRDTKEAGAGAAARQEVNVQRQQW